MDKIKELFDISGINCILLKTSHRVMDSNFYYFTKLDKSLDLNSILILRKNKKPVALASVLEYEELKKIPYFRTVKYESVKDLRKIFASLPKNVGLNYSAITLANLRSMRKIAKNRKFVDVSKHLAAIREIKTIDEVRKIKSACRITEEIFDNIPEITRAGMQEKNIAEKIRRTVEKYGACLSFPPIIAAGKNSSAPHHITGNTKIRRGNILLVDIGVAFSNYCSDLTRMFFVGRANEDIKNTYNVVKSAQAAAISMIRNGEKSKHIFNVANEIIKKELKQSMIHSLGHGIGLEVHDFPEGISDKSNYKLKENMVISIEPAYYGKKYGIRIEDNILVGKNSPKLLSKSPKEIVEI